MQFLKAETGMPIHLVLRLWLSVICIVREKWEGGWRHITCEFRHLPCHHQHHEGMGPVSGFSPPPEVSTWLFGAWIIVLSLQQSWVDIFFFSFGTQMDEIHLSFSLPQKVMSGPVANTPWGTSVANSEVSTSVGYFSSKWKQQNNLTFYNFCWWADHRICVWNAVDGSLVHSLTGHDKQVLLSSTITLNPKLHCCIFVHGFQCRHEILTGFLLFMGIYL
jgi:hypothetical protein